MHKHIVVIHHSLTKDGKVVDFNAIKNYHINHNGWRDIGYHYVLEYVDGKIKTFKGRNESDQAAAVKEGNLNNKAIHICVVGNFDVDKPTEEMYLKLSWLIKDIMKRWPIIEIQPHSKYAVNKDTGKSYKSCPGKNFNMAHLRKLVGV